MTPTQRTLKAQKEMGRVCAMVEKWNPHARRPGGGRGVRQDMFGIIDIIALDPKMGVVGIQSTGNDFSGHHKKLTLERTSECITWLKTPGTALELWSWRRVKKKRGGKAMVWAPRVIKYALSDFLDDILNL